MRKENKEKIFMGNDDFFSSMGEDAVQQQIQGEARFFRGLMRAIQKKQSLWVIFLGVLFFNFLFLLGLIFLALVFLAILSSQDQRPETFIQWISLLPWMFFGFLMIAISVKISIAFYKNFKQAKNTYRIKLLAIFVPSISLMLTVFVYFLKIATAS